MTHAPAGETFEWVFGQWNVPDVEPGGEGPGSWFAAEASFSMINLTTGVHVGFGQIPLTAPPGTASMENQAEWILERPELSTGQAQLPDFSEIYFNSAYAGRGLSFVAEGGAADTVLNMVENGTTVATTTIETPTLIKIDYTGGPPPAVAG